MTPGDAAKWLTLANRKFDTRVRLATRWVGDQFLSNAMNLSSGGYSLADLAAMDHPYARRHGGQNVPYGDPAKINKQSGEFMRYWKLDVGGYTARMYNFSPIGGYLVGGTSKMIARPIDKRIMERVMKDLRKKFEAEIAKAFK